MTDQFRALIDEHLQAPTESPQLDDNIPVIVSCEVLEAELSALSNTLTELSLKNVNGFNSEVSKFDAKLTALTSEIEILKSSTVPRQELKEVIELLIRRIGERFDCQPTYNVAKK